MDLDPDLAFDAAKSATGREPARALAVWLLNGGTPPTGKTTEEALTVLKVMYPFAVHEARAA